MVEKDRNSEKLLSAKAVGEMLSLSKRQIFRLNSCGKIYVEPRIHKRIVLTDTKSGNCTIITTLRRHGRLTLGFSAPQAVSIKHIEPTNPKEKYQNGEKTD